MPASTRQRAISAPMLERARRSAYVCPLAIVMEAEGIEPSSRDTSAAASTCLFRLLDLVFPGSAGQDPGQTSASEISPFPHSAEGKDQPVTVVHPGPTGGGPTDVA